MIASTRPIFTMFAQIRSSFAARHSSLSRAIISDRLKAPLAAATIHQRAHLSGNIGEKTKSESSASASHSEYKRHKLPKAPEKRASRLPIFPSADLPPAPSEVHQVIEQTQKTIEQKQSHAFPSTDDSSSSSREQYNATVKNYSLPTPDLPPHLTDKAPLSSGSSGDSADLALGAATKKQSHDPVIFYEAGTKCRILLNRPKQLNALNLGMIRSIQSRLKEWEKSPDMNAIIIKSESERAFCAGGDVVSVARSIVSNEAADLVTSKYKIDFFREEYTMNYTIGQLTIPYIAIIDGITMGGGVGLSVHGKFRVATERTVFAMPETGIGFFPDVGGTYVLPRLEDGLGTFLALTGYRLKGQDVWHARIATHFCQSSLLKELDQALLNLPVSADEAAICRVLDEFENRSLDDRSATNEHATSNESREFSLHPYRNIISSVFEHTESVEDIMQRLESPQEHADWCHSVRDTLQKMSPTSLKVTLRALREGATLPSLKECLKMEFRISQRFTDKTVTTDFYEGVRALLIDKDSRGAQWRPAKLENVHDDLVDEFFQPMRNAKDELELF